MVEDVKLSSKQRRSLLEKNETAVEMVVVHIDTDTVDRLKQQFGANWKKEAAAILESAPLDH